MHSFHKSRSGVSAERCYLGVLPNRVAQTSKSAVSQVSKPAQCECREVPRRADMDVGDTAGLETCATLGQHARLGAAKSAALCRDAATAGEAGCSRRGFLQATAQLLGGVALAGWASPLHAAASGSAAGAGGFAVIDAHTHFYDPARPQGVPWPPREEKLLYRTVLPKDYRALPVPLPVTGTVVVEASPWVEDNQWVLDLAAKEPLIVGLVGNLTVGTPAFAGHLKRFAANKLFRGIRIRDRKLEGALEEVAFTNDLKLLADQDLSLDLVGGREILPFADRLAKELPSLRIIIDHLAGLAVNGKAPPADWLERMRALARRPKVFCKLSGLVEGTGRADGSAPRDVEFYRPVLDAMRETFGPERLIYASNWPVSERFAPLATVEGIVADYFRSQGRRAEMQVFSQSATAAYRWVPREKGRD
jgi:L-fuconolactonase